MPANQFQQKLSAFARDNKWFLVPYVLLFVALATTMCVCAKPNLHLAFNSFHTPLGDVFFKYYTQVGEWVPYAVVVVLLFYRYGAALFVLLGQVTAAAVTHLLKNIVRAPRPKLYFAENFPTVQLPVVDGVHMHSTLSFPSGHTAAIFALFVALAVLTKNRPLKMLYLVLAALGGFSRIYLSQHFAADVLVGSFIGAISCSLWYFTRFPLHNSWSNRSLLSRQTC